MTRTEHFFALTTGRPEGTPHAQTVHDLGVLRVASGRLEASDPFVGLGEGLVVAVPVGTYPVRVTVADVSDAQDGSHEREAYLSLVLADGEVDHVSFLEPVGADPAPEGEHYGVGVDAGTVAFADADAIGRCMPDGDWYDDVFDDGTDTSWFSLMDSADHLRAGCANITMPNATAGENVVLCHSGWGDGFYPVLGTYAANGTLLGVHIDLGVAGFDEDSDDEE